MNAMCTCPLALTPPDVVWRDASCVSQATQALETFRTKFDEVEALKVFSKGLRVSGKLILGGDNKVAVQDTTFYVGPAKIDQGLIDDLKSRKSTSLSLDFPATSLDDVLQFFELGLGATTGQDSQVWRLEQVVARTHVTLHLTCLYHATTVWCGKGGVRLA